MNAVISKRFAKRQQMQWTKRGAHLLLQTRTRALDGTLRPLFERWYPGLANDKYPSGLSRLPLLWQGVHNDVHMSVIMDGTDGDHHGG